MTPLRYRKRKTYTNLKLEKNKTYAITKAIKKDPTKTCQASEMS